MRRGIPAGLLAALLCASPGAALETIRLRDGRSLAADEAWFEGTELRYRKDGALFSVPRELVDRVIPPHGAEPGLDPHVRRSRERLAAGDASEALRFARLALFRDPTSLTGRQALAAAQVALGDAAGARATAQSALEAGPADARTHELLGDALADLADFAAARGHYAASLSLADEARVRAKLESLLAGPPPASGARFRLRYDGAADEPLGVAVLRELDRAFDEYASRLGFAPAQPVTVVLQTAESFRDTTRAPDWAAAWNDGRIRVPVAGIGRPTPGLVRVLRHELAHSFVAARAGASCPTWLQEGLAQWLGGEPPARDVELLAPLARAGKLPRLESLEAAFVGLSEKDATLAYAQSLSVVAHVQGRWGEDGLRRLLDALGEGRPAAEALPIALGQSYGELQKDWEKSLRQPAQAQTPRR